MVLENNGKEIGGVFPFISLFISLYRSVARNFMCNLVRVSLQK
jgi:hypothetical protein